MDHMKQHGAEHQGHACGCGGPNGRKQQPAAEARRTGEGRVSGAALDILDERFARGDIEKAEYEEKKQLISQRAVSPQAGNADPSPAAPKPASPKHHAKRR